MKLHLKEVTTLLSVQDYLSYEKVLDKILKEVQEGGQVTIDGTNITLNTLKEVDAFNRKMIQVHGIYGLV